MNFLSENEVFKNHLDKDERKSGIQKIQEKKED